MVELFVARKVVVVWLATERVGARSTCTAKNGSARYHGILTDICEDVDRSARGKPALYEGLVELRAENRFEEVVHC